jgi:cell division protease FtsH
MSGFKENQGIIVVAATNRLDVLDEALLRPGRFDRHIEVGLPDVKARLDILKLHCRKKPLSDNVDLEKVAGMTVYFSGAKLENLINEAAITAVKENSDFITMEHLDKAYGVVLAGSEKKDRSSIKFEDKLITAYHEAGHALISRFVSPENTVRKITIIPSTKGAGGYTLNIPPDRMFHTRLQLLNNIKVSLGGRAAEEIVFGSENITTGAYGDIESATNTLVSMIKHYGMFEKTSLLNYDILEQNNITNSTDILSLCNEAIKSLYDEVLELLSSHRDILDRLADSLIKFETIYDDQLDSIISA